MRPGIKLSVWLTLLVCTRSICAQERPGDRVVVVFEIENRNSPFSNVELLSLTDFFGTQLGEKGNLKIIPSADVKRRLQVQKEESYKDCYDQKCQIEIGREMAAEMMVSATVSKIGNLCLVSAALYDLRLAATAVTASAELECTPDELINALRHVASKLRGDEKPKEGKSVLLAVVFSAIPGGGMYYVGKWGWGIFYTVSMTAGLVMMPLGFVHLDDSAGGPLTGVGALLLYGGMIASMIHAGIAAANWEPPEDQYAHSPARSLFAAEQTEIGFRDEAIIFPVLDLKF